MNVTFETIVSYLENLATQHIDVAEHFRWNKTELQGSLRSGVNLSLMLIDAPETQEEFPNNKSFHNHSCAITILGKSGVDTSKIDNYANQNEVLDHCQQICFEIAKRIKYDGQLPGWMYGLVVGESFHYFKVGPIFSNGYYGYRCEFNIKAKADCVVDTAKWGDL